MIAADPGGYPAENPDDAPAQGTNAPPPPPAGEAPQDAPQSSETPPPGAKPSGPDEDDYD